MAFSSKSDWKQAQCRGAARKQHAAIYHREVSWISEQKRCAGFSLTANWARCKLRNLEMVKNRLRRECGSRFLLRYDPFSANDDKCHFELQITGLKRSQKCGSGLGVVKNVNHNENTSLDNCKVSSKEFLFTFRNLMKSHVLGVTRLWVALN